MKINMSGTFTISIHQEAEWFVGTVAENNVSSYWKTEDEALRNTQEALELWMESETYRTECVEVDDDIQDSMNAIGSLWNRK